MQEEDANRPARVVLISIPDKSEIRQKNLFNVDTCDMYWHPQGHYLAVQVQKKSKTGKSTTTNFEFFRMNEPGIPLEMMDLPNKSSAAVVSFEPRGSRLAIVHGGGAGARPDVSLFNMAGGKGGSVGAGAVSQVTLITSLKGKAVSHIFWSPMGKNVVLAGLGSSGNGQLEFFNAEELQTMNFAEHFMCSSVSWDPSGRFVASSVLSLGGKNQMDNGVTIWSFSGREIYRVPRDCLHQFQWRPRPPTLLSNKEEKKIMKELRTFSKKYEEEDKTLLMQASDEVMRRRKALQDKFAAWHDSKKDWLAQARDFIQRKYPHLLVEGKHTVQEVSREEIISMEEVTV